MCVLLLLLPPWGELSRRQQKILSAVAVDVCPSYTPVMRRRDGSQGGHNFYYGRNEKAQRQLGVHTSGERREAETQVCVGGRKKAK